MCSIYRLTPVTGTGSAKKTCCGNPLEQHLLPNADKGAGAARKTFCGNPLEQLLYGLFIYPEIFTCFMVRRVLVPLAPYSYHFVRLPTFSPSSAPPESRECFSGCACPLAGITQNMETLQLSKNASHAEAYANIMRYPPVIFYRHERIVQR